VDLRAARGAPRAAAAAGLRPALTLASARVRLTPAPRFPEAPRLPSPTPPAFASLGGGALALCTVGVFRLFGSGAVFAVSSPPSRVCATYPPKIVSTTRGGFAPPILLC